MKEKLLTKCRVAVFECILTKEQRELLQSLSEQTQAVANRFVEQWLVHHIQNGSREKLADWLAELREAREQGKKSKAKCPVNFLPDGFKPDEIRKWTDATDEFSLKGRVAGLTLKRLEQTLRTKKASRGSLSGWIAILMNRESIPSYTSPLPIPFDSHNSRHPDRAGCCGIVRRENNEWDLRVSLTQGRNEYETIPLLTRKRKAAKQRIHLERIDDGRYKFSGSQIYRDRSTGKWMVAICYQDTITQTKRLDHEKVAVLSPGRIEPWILQMQEGVYWRGGTGAHVTAMRMRLQQERSQRSEHYRYCGTDRKGHGGKTARLPWEKLSSKWKNFQKRYNEEVTTQIVREIVNRGYGTLEYLQPEGEKSNTRFLSVSGMRDGSFNLRGWEYHQVKTMLARKCESEGVQFNVVKCTGKNRELQTA